MLLERNAIDSIAFFSQCTNIENTGMHTEKKCYWIYRISAKSMFIIDLNQNAIELVAYV